MHADGARVVSQWDKTSTCLKTLPGHNLNSKKVEIREPIACSWAEQVVVSEAARRIFVLGDCDVGEKAKKANRMDRTVSVECTNWR